MKREVRRLKRLSRRESIPDYVDTLDGFRALGTLLVVAFHYWQQSWIALGFTVLGYRVDTSNLVVNGAFGVELLFLLSGFCLYYPLAMHPERPLSLGNYVYKRAVRILPSYFLCVIVSAASQIGRLDPALLREQFWGNMTLTQMMTPSLAYNHLNGPLWSIAIEAQFYVVFPLLAKAFKKRPFGVMLGAFLIAEGWRWYLRDIDYSRIGFLMNQLPAMIDVFVGGMLAAHVVACCRRGLRGRQQQRLAPAFAVATLAFLLLWILAAKYMGRLRFVDMPENESRMRMDIRKFLVAGFGGSIACSAMASKWLRRALGNPVSRFISAISYQIYLWHAWYALRLKEWHIPPYATERAMDDEAWRWPFLWLCLALTLATALLLTYGFERPISRFAMRRMPRWARPREDKEE